MKCSRTSAFCPLRKTSCHRRREEKFPPQRRRGAENAENAEEYANSHCLCDLCVLCASAVKVLVLLLTASGSKPSLEKDSYQRADDVEQPALVEAALDDVGVGTGIDAALLVL